MIENGSTDITVYIRVMEDPTGFLWHNFVKSVIRISHDIDLTTLLVMTQRKRPALWASTTREVI